MTELLPGTSETTACEGCGKRYRRTSVQKRRGRRFCSWDCYLKNRGAIELEARNAKQSQECANDDCQNVGTIVARGLCRACYQQWRSRFGPSAKWLEKTCPTCSKVFPTHTDRTFCSLRCYVASDVFRAARQKFSDRMNEMAVAAKCLNCERDMLVAPKLMQVRRHADGMRRTPKRFCCISCYREWFAARFDNMVAEHTALQLPCSYDEFLSQDELPCLVDGCEWIGHNLSAHCNMAHAITANQLKALAGFNRGTGVISKTARKNFSAVQVARGAGLPNFNELSDEEAIRRPRGPIRPEGKEHHAKARALQ